MRIQKTKYKIAALGLWLVAAPAWAADIYVDNTSIAAGTVSARVDGDTLTLPSVAGLEVGHGFYLSGTGVDGVGSERDVHYKILSLPGGNDVNLTEDGTTAASIPAGVNNTTLYQVRYGSDVNTGLSPTKGGTTTGPKLTLSASHLAAGNGNIFIKAGNNPSTNPYDEFQRITQYLQIGNGVTQTWQGYFTTPGDLDESVSSTYAAGVDGKVRLTGAGGEDLVNYLAYPEIRTNSGVSGIGSVYVFSASGAQTFKNLFISSASTSGNKTIITVNSAAASVTLQRCAIGREAFSESSQYGIWDISGSGQTKTILVDECRGHTTSSFIRTGPGLAVTLTDNYIRQNPDGNVQSTIYFDSSSGSNNPSNPLGQCLRLTMDSNDIAHTADETHTACAILAATDALYSDIRVLRNKFTVRSPSACINITGSPFFDIDRNYVYHTNSTTGLGNLISLGTDNGEDLWSYERTRPAGVIASALATAGAAATITTPTTDDTGLNGYANLGIRIVSGQGAGQRRIIASNTDGAGGASVVITVSPNWTTAPNNTSVYVIGGFGLVQSATASTVVLAATESASADYDQKNVRILTDAAAGLWQQRVITGYVGATDTATVSLNWYDTPGAGSLYELFDDVLINRRVTDNWCEYTLAVSDNRHGILVGQGMDECEVTGNTVLRADYALVLKSEHGHCAYNNVWSGRTSMLFKGGSFWFAHNNSLVMGMSGITGDAVISFIDVSVGETTAAVPALMHQKHYSKAVGNTVINNIACVIGVGTGNPYCLYEDVTDTGKWATLGATNPLKQANKIDWNLYFVDEDGDGITEAGDLPYHINGSPAGNIGATGLADLRTLWSTYSTQFPLNDANSRYGNPGFGTAYQSGRFNITSASPAFGAGSTGGSMGSYSPARGGGGGAQRVMPRGWGG